MSTSHRYEPYRDYRFRVKWEGAYELGKSRHSFDPVFQRWAGMVWDYSDTRNAPANSGQPLPPQDIRKNLVIEIYNAANQRVTAYRIHGCWVSQFNGVPELDSIGNVLSIESMVLQHAGWEVQRGGAG